MKKSLPISLAIISLGYFLSFHLTKAAEITTTAIPPRLEVSATPGETIKTKLKIRNDTPTTQYYKVAVDDFIVSDENGTPIPVTESVSSRWSMKKWITAPDFVPVDPKATQEITVNITVPANALPGGHYAMVTYQPNPGAKLSDLQKTGSLIGQRTGSLLYLTVAGPINQKASIFKFFTSKFQELGPVKFEGLINNTSDTHINPKGDITITNFLGQKVATLPVEIGNIFPETSRTFTSTWNQKWGYGKYSATLRLAYGTAGGILLGTIYFWLFPIRLIIYVLTLIVAVLLFIVLINKRSRKHQQELETEVKELQEKIQDLEQQQ